MYTYSLNPLLGFSSDREDGGRYAIVIYKTTNSYFVTHMENTLLLKFLRALDNSHTRIKKNECKHNFHAYKCETYILLFICKMHC